MFYYLGVFIDVQYIMILAVPAAATRPDDINPHNSKNI